MTGDPYDKTFQAIAERLQELHAAINRVIEAHGKVCSKVKALDERVSNLETSIDCLIDDSCYVAGDEVGFNAQLFRKQIFLELLGSLDFDIIVETGTWTGNTTGFMAENSGLPVHSVEISERFHSIARMRLKEVPNIHLYQGESSEFLQQLSVNPSLTSQRCFFYLDAHWYDDLPLERELEIISRSWKDFVVMVDDFEVPGDPDYGFDHYPNGERLDYQTYRKLFDRLDLKAFFPALPGSQETGGCRGCVILASSGPISERLETLQTLRTHT
ncbi:MAG: hypothetical protein D6698_01180 [Gammaproteobacteria bacterium]|nr:MAG: hypothetical protein D6698_01180 [Gammaproteobacteria bacterium]